MNYVLAIDVGTSFTAAAIVRTEQNAQPVPESLPLGLRGMAVPSVVYYPAEGPILVGEPAERRGLDTPERVVREFKRRLGDEVPISVGTLLLPAEEVFATMARWVVDRAQEREGAPPSGIVLSHPASWGTHRTDLILGALAAKGLDNVTLLSEPEAAALHYASQVRVENGSTIAVYDLGGGTFDTAVLRKAGAGHFQLLGRPEGIEGLGGADFDAAVLRHVTEHSGQALAALDTSAPATLAAFARLRRECVEAKEALSSDSEASISVLLPGVQQQVRLVRSEFESMIEGPVRETVDALENSLQELGLTPADLSAVLLIGGSSRIPLVAQLISEQLDRPIAVDADPKSSICLGAAVSMLRLPAVAEPMSTAIVQPEAEVHAADVGTAGARSLPSWSRKTLTASSAAGGVHSSGPKAGTARGAHAPRASVRLTAVAAAAALFTGLTATAAQSPDGFGSLTALFVPEAEAHAKQDPGTAPGSASVPGGSGAGSAAAGGGGAQVPMLGIEASAKKGSGSVASAAGLDVEASPTSRPSAARNSPAAGGAEAGTGTAGGAPAGSLSGGTPGGAAEDTTQGSGGSGMAALPPSDTPVPSDPPPPEPSDTPVPSDTPSPEPSDTPVPSDPPSPEPSDTPVPSDTPSPEPTDTPVPSDPPPPEPSDTPVPSDTPLPEPSESAVPSDPPSPEPSDTGAPLATTATESPAPVVAEPGA